MEVPALEPADHTVEMSEIRCPTDGCGSTDCGHCGGRPRKMSGVSVRYRCGECGTRFTHRPGLLGRHYPDGVITGAVNCVAAGKSCGAAARDTDRHVDSRPKEIIPNQSTVWRWTRYARDTTSLISSRILIRASGKWSTDEHHYTNRGRGMYEYGVMNAESRFMLSRDTSAKKIDYDATDLFRRAVNVAHVVARVLSSDKLKGFRTGFAKVMRGRKRRAFSGPVHNNAAGINKIKTHNNHFESYNGTVKNRTKTARGFNSGDPPLLGLLVTYYNFLRPHMGLGGRMPADVMGIKIQGSDKWATLIAFGASGCC